MEQSVLSKSTDKLKIIEQMLSNLPDGKVQRIKVLEIDWTEILTNHDAGPIAVPNLHIEFFE